MGSFAWLACINRSPLRAFSIAVRVACGVDDFCASKYAALDPRRRASVCGRLRLHLLLGRLKEVEAQRA